MTEHTMTPDVETLRRLLAEEVFPYELNPEWERVVNVKVVEAAHNWADLADPSPETVERVARRYAAVLYDAPEGPVSPKRMEAMRAALAVLVSPQDRDTLHVRGSAAAEAKHQTGDHDDCSLDSSLLVSPQDTGGEG